MGQASQQRSWCLYALRPDGKILVTTYTRTDLRGPPLKQQRVSERALSPEQLLLLWNAQSACGFKTMAEGYKEPGFNRRYAIPSRISVTANGVTKQVWVSPKTVMRRFEYLFESLGTSLAGL